MKYCTLYFLVAAAVLPALSASAQKSTAADTATLVVNSQSQYSQAFLDKLKTFTYSYHYQLSDSLLVIGKLDTAYFPTELPLRKSMTFTGTMNNSQLQLSVKRTNYTTITYHLMVFKSAKMSAEYKGEADLGAGFFLAAEIDEDDRTGNAYPANEYYATAKDCRIGIRIGLHESRLLAKVVVGCKDKSQNIDLDDCPTLYMK